MAPAPVVAARFCAPHATAFTLTEAAISWPWAQLHRHQVRRRRGRDTGGSVPRAVRLPPPLPLPRPAPRQPAAHPGEPPLAVRAAAVGGVQGRRRHGRGRAPLHRRRTSLDVDAVPHGERERVPRRLGRAADSRLPSLPPRAVQRPRVHRRRLKRRRRCGRRDRPHVVTVRVVPDV